MGSFPFAWITQSTALSNAELFSASSTGFSLSVQYFFYILLTWASVISEQLPDRISSLPKTSGSLWTVVSSL